MTASAALLVAQFVKYKSCIQNFGSQPKKSKIVNTRTKICLLEILSFMIF